MFPKCFLLFFSFFFFLRRMLFPTLMPFHCFIMHVLVVANLANTNALILKEFAPSITKKNIACLTRLDHNRALSQIAERLKFYVTNVKNVIIWGNHSATQYSDINHATSPSQMERDQSKNLKLTIIGISKYLTCLFFATFTCLNYLET